MVARTMVAYSAPICINRLRQLRRWWISRHKIIATHIIHSILWHDIAKQLKRTNLSMLSDGRRRLEYHLQPRQFSVRHAYYCALRLISVFAIGRHTFRCHTHTHTQRLTLEHTDNLIGWWSTLHIGHWLVNIALCTHHADLILSTKMIWIVCVSHFGQMGVTSISCRGLENISIVLFNNIR